MGKNIKFLISGDRGIETQDMDLESAKKTIAEAKAQGRFIINRQNGELIEDLNADVEEVLIIDIVEGG
jgi:hypothetical protein